MLKANFPEMKDPSAASALHLEFEIEHKIEQCSMSALSGHLLQHFITKCCKHVWCVELNFHYVQSSTI